jgi:phosphoribosylaminoimidazole (AIR) synthetase
MIIVSTIVMGWEVFEVVVGGELAKTYGSLERWFYDTAGDIIGAMVVSVIVVSVLWGKQK